MKINKLSNKLLLLLLSILICSPSIAEIQLSNHPEDSLASTSSIFGKSPKHLENLNQNQLNDFGKELITQLFFLLSRVGSKTGEIGGKPNEVFSDAVNTIKQHLDDDALIQGARSSTPVTKTTYNPSDYDNFLISDLQLTHPRNDVLVIRYKVQAPNRVQLESGEYFSGLEIPRLTVFIWSPTSKQWKLFSHADFDYPVAKLCGAYNTTLSELVGDHGSAKDISIARTFVDEYLQQMMQGDPRPMMSRDMQSQYGSGVGWTGVENFKKPNLKISLPKHFYVSRKNDLMAISYAGTPTELVVGDVEHKDTLIPILYTIMKDHNKNWKIIASAIFATPKKLTNNLECKSPTIKHN